MKSKYLIAYFQLKGEESKSAKVAEAIEAHMTKKGHKPEMFAITPVETYPEGENEFMAATKAEAERRSRPEIVGKISDGMYRDIRDIILVAPNWWNSVPMAVLTFLDQHDNTNKRLVPVILHGGDGPEAILKELREFMPRTDVMPAVPVSHEDMADLTPRVNRVMEELGQK